MKRALLPPLKQQICSTLQRHFPFPRKESNDCWRKSRVSRMTVKALSVYSNRILNLYEYDSYKKTCAEMK